MLQRIEALKTQMRKNACDLVIISPSADMRYLCGLHIPPDERCELLFVYADRKPALLLSQLYLGEAESLKKDFNVLFTSPILKYEAALKQLLPQKPFKVAIDNRMWAVQLLRLQEQLPSNCSYFPASQLLDELRIIKEPNELILMKKAGEIAAEAWKRSIKKLHIDMTEKELAAILEIEMKKGGAEALAFDTIVAFGKNAALPHHVPDDTKLQPNQFVLMDFGCVYDGYCSDITRTVCFGKADTKMRAIYEQVLFVKTEVKKCLHIGMTAGEVEQIARHAFAQNEPAFIHRISHGLGLYVHEAPNFSTDSCTVLREGMVFSVEPGLYYRGEIGVRIEDAVALTDNGWQDMHILPDKLMEISVK